MGLSRKVLSPTAKESEDEHQPGTLVKGLLLREMRVKHVVFRLIYGFLRFWYVSTYYYILPFFIILGTYYQLIFYNWKL